MLYILRSIIRYFAIEHGKLRWLYRRINRPDSVEFAEFLRRHGEFYAIGERCSINIGANITDPRYVRIGNNCALSSCTLLGHDGIIRVIQNATGKKFDSVGKIDIRDNCFVGHGSIVLPGVTIGPNAVVAAGSVVSRDVPPNTVVGGVPAKRICSMDELVDRMEVRSRTYPWHDLILKREGHFDPAMEEELVRMRVDHFYGKSSHGA